MIYIYEKGFNNTPVCVVTSSFVTDAYPQHFLGADYAECKYLIIFSKRHFSCFLHMWWSICHQKKKSFKSILQLKINQSLAIFLVTYHFFLLISHEFLN